MKFAWAVTGVVMGVLLVGPRSTDPTPKVSAAPSIGEQLYLHRPQAIVAAIRTAEGVPSYGVMALADLAGGHHLVPEDRGRRAAAALVHVLYRRWVREGRPGDFLVWLAGVWAPVGARNDPTGLNAHFLSNMLAALPDEVLAEMGRELVRGR